MSTIPHTPLQHPTAEPLHPREYEHEAEYRAYLFGLFRLLRGARPLETEMPRRNKALMILKWFLLHPGKPVSADELVDLFWPDSSPEKAVGNFHVTMHCLRRTLEPNLHPRQDSAFILRGPNNFYCFQHRDTWWTDIGDLEQLYERAQLSDEHGDRRRACFFYRRVAGYCLQGLLPDDECAEWLVPYRRRYRQIHTQALMRLMHLHTHADEPEELLEYAYQMLEIDRCNEKATQVIVDAHIRSGNLVRAQQRLELFGRALERELGLRTTRAFHTLRDRICAAGRG